MWCWPYEEMVPMLPLHLSGNKQLRQTKLSSFFLSLCLPVCQTPTLAVLWLQYPAQSYSYLKQAMYSTLACASPFRAAYILSVSCCRPSFLLPVSLQHLHAPSLTRCLVCNPRFWKVRWNRTSLSWGCPRVQNKVGGCSQRECRSPFCHTEFT